MRPPGSPRTGVPGRLEYERAAGERPPRARPQRRGSPGPIPNPAVKPAFAESTAAQGCGRAGRRARGGRFSIAPGEARGGMLPPAGLSVFWGEGPRSSGVFRPLHRPACGGARARLAQGTRQECYARGPRDRSGNLPLCGPFLRYGVERCLPDASLVLSEVVLIQNEFAVSAVGYVGGFGCYLIVYET